VPSPGERTTAADVVAAPDDKSRETDAGSGDPAYKPTPRAKSVGPVPPPGAGHIAINRVASPANSPRLKRTKRAWRWQDGYHDRKLRTPASETQKWEYVCLNPVRGKLVERPEQWPFGGEISYDESGDPRLIRGTPPILENRMLIESYELETKPPIRPPRSNP
jgi:hypothetical protein